MFRLATVDVGGGRIRTRVVVTRLAGDSFKGGSTSLVVETITDEGSSRYLDHAPLYDYDFDVDTLYKNEQFKVYGAQGARDATLGVQDKYASGLFEYHVLNIVVLSGARADGDDTSLPKAATDLVFTVLNIPAYVLFGYDYDGRKVTGDPGVLRPTGLFDQVTMPGKGAIGSNPDDFHSVSNIRLRTVNSLYNPASCFICLLDRVGKSAEQTVSEQADPHLGVLIIDWFSGEIARPDLSAFDIGDFDSSVYELVVHPLTLWTTKSAYTLMLRGAETASYVLLSVNTRMGSVDFLVRCEDYDPNVRLVPWPGHDCFLASFPNDDSALGAGPDEHDYAQWTLHQLNWSDDPKPRLVGDKVGPQGFNVGNFACNPAGSFLFWPQSREVDEDRVYDPDGVEDVCVRPSTYHIKGSRIRESHFSDPFIVADLASDTDDLVVVDTLARTPLVAVRTELVPSTISDGKGGQVPKYTDDEGQTIYSAAHLFYTEVPTVRCATPVSCEAPNPFVTPGGSIEFHVALRNDGNVFLSGCTLSMWLLDEATDSYDLVDEALAQLVFDEESLQESNYNRRGDDGALEDVEPDYALCPGKTSVYSVSVTVPKTWEEGPKHVLFVAYDARVSPDPALSPLQQQASAQSDTFPQAPDPNDGVLEFHVEPGDIDFVPIRTAPSSHQDANPRHMETIHVLQPTVAGDFMPAPVRESDTNGTPDVVPVRRVTPNGQGGPSWNGLGGRTSSLPSGSLPSGVASRTWRSDGHGWTGSTGSPSAGASMSSAAGATTSPAASQYVGQTVSGVTAPAPAAGASGATATGASTAQTAPSSRLVSGAGGLAHTGDDGGSGALAAGIAAIGAAALAYERRRARNERG